MLLLSGNRCDRGLLFARFQLENTTDYKINLKYPGKELEEEEKNELLSFWNLEGAQWIKSDNIAGSPERSEFRTLVKHEDQTYLLEQFPRKKAEEKEKIARRLLFMEQKDLPVTPPQAGRAGFLFHKQQEIWQLTPYKTGSSLNRKDYWKNKSKGQNLGHFLASLKQLNLPVEEGEESFDTPSFLIDLWAKMERSEYSLFQKIQPVIAYLERDFLPRLSLQPDLFSHGDPHPMNIIWRGDSILSVIDWEFSGPKPHLYDPALALGCVGSEDPKAFTAGFNSSLIKVLQGSGFYSREEWSILFPQILAQRFAWMNEWLRHEDNEMQQQEILYMHHLLEHFQKLL